jgi:hypothetical protein
MMEGPTIKPDIDALGVSKCNYSPRVRRTRAGCFGTG